MVGSYFQKPSGNGGDGLSRLEDFQRKLNLRCPYANAQPFLNVYRFSHRRRIETVYEILHKVLNPQKLLLDAGCWVGPYSVLLSDYVSVVGIDVSRRSIRKAKEWRELAT